jgi:hypothetical protein
MSESRVVSLMELADDPSLTIGHKLMLNVMASVVGYLEEENFPHEANTLEYLLRNRLLPKMKAEASLFCSDERGREGMAA